MGVKNEDRKGMSEYDSYLEEKKKKDKKAKSKQFMRIGGAAVITIILAIVFSL